MFYSHFNGEIPVDLEYSFGDEYGPNQYGLVVYGTIGHTPEPAVQYVKETRNAKQMLQFLDEVKFEGGGCEECSLLAEALSIALQIFDERTLQRGQGYKGIVRKSCIVVCNSPPFGLPSYGCADDYSGKTVEQLAEEMGQKKGIHLSIIAPRKIPALQRAFERSLTVDSKSVLSKDYSKDPNHLVCIQGLDLPDFKSVTRNSDSQAEVSKNGVHMSDANVKPVVTPSQLTASGTLKESPEKPVKKQKTGPRQPSLTETKLLQLADSNIPLNIGPTPNIPISQVQLMVNSTSATPATSLNNNASAAQQKAKEILSQALRQANLDRNTTPNSVQPQPSPMQDAVTGASVNWTQPTNQQPRVGPTPGGVPAASSENPQVAQRALAWTGHLEWQDTLRDPNGPQQRITRSLACHASVVSGDTLKAKNWPPKLIMQLIPQNLLSTLGPLLQNSKTVAFHFAPNDQESLRALYRVMASNGVKFAGCVHFPPVPQCDVKVLLLIFSPKKRAFVGLIPVEQVCISVYVTVHVYQNCLVCVLGVTLH
ncbi:mediator of RNA polymerase II transcription subunit 25-like isoform X1 [Orbicella faveolata]|uniref:mediator of RNA polymerase II transcription subunit 25-like isoform X1 n=1 Tax=Orbicella faveolata TaxID=48498 RepID=UPI0009E5A81F|nr:mediator of RNA polymerase II transcription subunit 25-like isoform X1 [Orbicella faveolata]